MRPEDEAPVDWRKRQGDAYLDTVKRLEPEITPIDAAAFYASAAISLKRIADSLEFLCDLQRPASGKVQDLEN